jgi:hypothetical protein
MSFKNDELNTENSFIHKASASEFSKLFYSLPGASTIFAGLIKLPQKFCVACKQSSVDNSAFL